MLNDGDGGRAPQPLTNCDRNVQAKREFVVKSAPPHAARLLKNTKEPLPPRVAEEQSCSGNWNGEAFPRERKGILPPTNSEPSSPNGNARYANHAIGRDENEVAVLIVNMTCWHFTL
jgi:hypothetical protein